MCAVELLASTTSTHLPSLPPFVPPSDPNGELISPTSQNKTTLPPLPSPSSSDISPLPGVVDGEMVVEEEEEEEEKRKKKKKDKKKKRKKKMLNVARVTALASASSTTTPTLAGSASDEKGEVDPYANPFIDDASS